MTGVRIRPPRPRRSSPRSRSLSEKNSKRLVFADREPDDGLHFDRPLTRGDCRDAERPCPWVACSKHLYLDINPETGTIKLNFPNLEPWDLAESCSVDVGERGPQSLEGVGILMNLTRERVRQIEVRALHHSKQHPTFVELAELLVAA